MFRITVIPLRDRQICWQLILTVGIRNCHPIRRHENYRLSSSDFPWKELFVFSALYLLALSVYPFPSETKVFTLMVLRDWGAEH